MDGENNGKTLFFNGGFGGIQLQPTIFGNIHIYIYNNGRTHIHPPPQVHHKDSRAWRRVDGGWFHRRVPRSVVVISWWRWGCCWLIGVNCKWLPTVSCRSSFLVVIILVVKWLSTVSCCCWWFRLSKVNWKSLVLIREEHVCVIHPKNPLIIVQLLHFLLESHFFEPTNRSYDFGNCLSGGDGGRENAAEETDQETSTGGEAVCNHSTKIKQNHIKHLLGLFL